MPSPGWPLGWDLKGALIAGTALSTTSLAVVYEVLVETGPNRTQVGKLLMGACFVTDLATALALSAIFHQPERLPRSVRAVGVAD